LDSKLHEPQSDSVDTSLLDENLRLREESARLQQELAESNRKIWSMTVDRLIASIQIEEAEQSDLDRMARELGERTPEDLWASIEEIRHDGDANLTYSYDEDVEAFFLLMEIMKRGSEGVKFMAALAKHPLPDQDRVTAEEYNFARETKDGALEVLAYTRHEDALKALLELRQSTKLEEPIGSSKIAHHVSNLPHEIIKPLVPQILDVITEEAKGDNLSRQFVEVAANLAFRYEENRAYRLLTDPRVLNQGMRSTLELAAETHSRRSRDFIRWVAENHENEGPRDVAWRFLEAW
jgi:hypothetical protein